MFGSGITGSYGSSIFFLIFWGISILVFLVAASIYIPTKNVGEFQFLHTFSSTYYL